MQILSQSSFVPLVTTTKISRSSRVSNSSHNMVRFGQHLITSKVAISISSQRGRGSRCVAKALFGKFNEKSMDVVKLAKAEARRLGHNFIGREEILLGIIAEDSSIAAKVLSSMGINLKDARVEVENIVGRGRGVVTSDVIYTFHARCALELSVEVSLQLGHKYIGPEHLLLGLLRETEGVAARILENLGADLRKINKEVIRKIFEIEAASGKKMSMPTLEELIKPTKLEVKEIENIMLQEVIDRLKDKEIKLQVTERFRERVVEEGYDPSYGARLRSLRRAMRLLEDSMAEKMMAGEIKEGDSVTVDIDSDGNITVLNGQ